MSVCMLNYNQHIQNNDLISKIKSYLRESSAGERRYNNLFENGQ